MSTSDSLRPPAAVLLAYMQDMLSTDPHTHRAQSWSKRLVARIEREREAIRVEESGGGMCHLVTELLWDRHGWARLPVSYLADNGDVISAGHLVCLLPDGSVLDATADQFGEGHSVRVLRQSDADYCRYRPEFDEDFNPALFPELLAGMPWNGVADHVYQDRLRQERGLGWWLDDTTAYRQYLEHQVALGGECYREYLTALEAAALR